MRNPCSLERIGLTTDSLSEYCINSLSGYEQTSTGRGRGGESTSWNNLAPRAARVKGGGAAQCGRNIRETREPLIRQLIYWSTEGFTQPECCLHPSLVPCPPTSEGFFVCFLHRVSAFTLVPHYKSHSICYIWIKLRFWAFNCACVRKVDIWMFSVFLNNNIYFFFPSSYNLSLVRQRSIQEESASN